ncbi:DUF4190 domain-containing protein [Nonomuraea turcica]|uniref:DUF4190 domain-containing protein n=1 Tax=Nonomuraea sp. G32 TaxID=3067274 RepID=UPI00273B3D15|nr:hypothetical protein [Nonomuraea sp. G32]MDP4509597.1 hypothetical protein [Nonomuraea sp. G32]
MTTSGDPNEPRQGKDPREDRPEEGEHAPEWWREGAEENERPGQEERPPTPGPYEPRPYEPEAEPEPPAREDEEPIAPAPPVVPPPDVPPTHEPRPAEPTHEPRPVEPTHPDLPTAPETPEPSVGDAETTQAYPIPGATPRYPGWEGAPREEEPPSRPAPSRYEQGAQSGQPPVSPYGQYAAGPPEQPPSVPGTIPSSPYGGPPGYGPPPPGAPYGHPGPPYPQPEQQDRTGQGLATAALVLGVASPFLVFVCFTGLITAILSIVFGCVALARHAGRGRAIAGIVISVLSLVLFSIVALWFWNVVQQCAYLPSDQVDRCFEERFPWMSGAGR